VLHDVRVVKNVTLTLPDHVALQARIWAAEADTSVSQFLSRMLVERMERESSYEPSGTRYLTRSPVQLREDSQIYPNREELHDRADLR
jgi:hypothetical protein